MKEKNFEELYLDILHQKVRLEEPLPPEYHPLHLDCLLHPEQYAKVVQNDLCASCEEGDAPASAFSRACVNSCMFDAISVNEEGRLWIDPAACVGCEACIMACKEGKLTASRDVLPAMKAVREKKTTAYALVAPAFLGQFGSGVTPGKLRSAFRALGFDGMVEVALFADILTMKEALEFEAHVQEAGDFQLTSCCCPVWIAMIRKDFRELVPQVPGAVSPMIAAGRVVKHLDPDAVTVFVGPCLAKKREAQEEDIADAIDFVLTFQEMKDIFEAADMELEKLPEDIREHSSGAGRIYAHTGGVSEAVRRTVEQLYLLHGQEDTKGEKTPEAVIAEQADGVANCKAMLERIKKGESKANFYEGMGCNGGCVGGPRVILPPEDARARVEAYGKDAPFFTPLENPYVIKLVERLGYETVEELLTEEEMFIRRF